MNNTYICSTGCLLGIESEKINQYNSIKIFEPYSDISDLLVDIGLNRKAIRRVFRHVNLALASSKLALENISQNISDDYVNSVFYATSCDESKENDGLQNVLLNSFVNGELSYELLGTKGFDALPPLDMISRLPNTAAGAIAIEFKLKGMNYSIVNNANGGLISVGEGFFNIQNSYTDTAICGGVTPPRSYFKDFRNGFYSKSILSNPNFYRLEGAVSFFLANENFVAKNKINTIGQIKSFSSRYIGEDSVNQEKQIQLLFSELKNNANITPDKIFLYSYDNQNNELINKALNLFSTENISSNHILNGYPDCSGSAMTLSILLNECDEKNFSLLSLDENNILCGIIIAKE